MYAVGKNKCYKLQTQQLSIKRLKKSNIFLMGSVSFFVLSFLVKADSRYAFFLIAIKILLIITNGFYMTERKCSHCATVTTSPSPIWPIVSKNKSQSQPEKRTQCERVLTQKVRDVDSFVLLKFQIKLDIIIFYHITLN